MSTPSSTEPTPRPWEIDWYVATADTVEEATLGDCQIGDELWRVARSIGPIRPEHDHWASWHVANENDAIYAAEAINAHDQLRHALERVAALYHYKADHIDHRSGDGVYYPEDWRNDCQSPVCAEARNALEIE